MTEPHQEHEQHQEASSPMEGSGPNGRLKTQAWTQRVIVSSLVVIAFISIIAISWLAFMGRDCPPALAALGAASLGALASALSPARMV